METSSANGILVCSNSSVVELIVFKTSESGCDDILDPDTDLNIQIIPELNPQHAQQGLFFQPRKQVTEDVPYTKN
jgi:hypothetical protein